MSESETLQELLEQKLELEEQLSTLAEEIRILEEEIAEMQEDEKGEFGFGGDWWK